MSAEKSEREAMAFAVDKLRKLVPQIEEDIGRMDDLFIFSTHINQPCTPGTVTYPEQVLKAHMVYLRASVVSIAEALSSSPKLEKANHEGEADNPGRLQASQTRKRSVWRFVAGVFHWRHSG